MNTANIHDNFTTPTEFRQQLENLPDRILALPRFLKTRTDNPKAPAVSKWQLPENQRLCSELEGIRGFVAATEEEGGLLFLDFDHATDTDGKFVNAEAERWYNNLRGNGFFCERSQSNTGLHMFALPTAGKFGKVVGKIYFDADKKSFLEVFYGTTKFCLPTGNLFHCEPKAPIATGEAADAMLQSVIDELEKQKQLESTTQQKINQPPRRSEPIDRDELDRPTEQERAVAMLPFIEISDGDHDRWIHVGMILKANGNSLSDWDDWSAKQPNYTPDKHGYSCAEKWATFPDTCAMTIATLHDWATEGGYSEKEFLREWYDQHPNSKSYRRARQVSDLTTKDKIPDCPVDLILPRDVLFNDEGITLVESRRDDKPRYITAATTPIVPTKILRDETSGLVQYELAILTQGIWRRHVVDGRTIQSPRCIDKLANFGALIKPTPLCEYFTRIIAANSERLKMWRVFAQPGWKDDKFQQFIYPTGSENYIVDRAGYKYKTDYSERGNADEWRQIFGEAMKAGGRIARIFCGVAVAAPLIRPLKVTNMQAHLFGGVNAGKTVLARLIASIWGNPQDLLMTFESSPKRRQADDAAYNDLPTIYDELETVRGQRAEMSLTQSVYAFFNGKGNQNLNVDGTARDTFKFTGSRLSTGERQILKVADQYGAYKRLVPIECKGKIFAKQLATRIFRFTEDNFGHFGREWTTYIADHLTAIRDKYEAMEQVLLTDEIHEETQLRTICAAGVAYQFFAQYVGLQDGFDDSTFMADVTETIDELPTVEESSDSARALDVLKDIVASNEDRFYLETTNPHAPRYHEFEPKANGEHWGKLYLDGAVAIYPTPLSDILVKKGFASPEMLIRTWSDEGKLIANDGRNTRQMRIGDTRQRTIYFKAGILSEDRDDKALQDDAPPT